MYICMLSADYGSDNNILPNMISPTIYYNIVLLLVVDGVHGVNNYS